MTLNAPPSGENDHFWPSDGHPTFAAGTVAGIFVEAQMKTSDPSANLVGQLGADWWRNSTAQYAGLNVNNTAAGLSDWVKLTTSYQTLYFTTLTAAQLTADPPPGLSSTTASTPTATTPAATTPAATTPAATTPAATTPAATTPAAPTVAITSAGGTVTQAAQTISGTVDVADAGTTVKVLDGTTQIGSATVAANGAWSANVTLANQGANVLTATDANAGGRAHPRPSPTR